VYDFIGLCLDVFWNVLVKVMLAPVAISGLFIEKIRICCNNLKEDAHARRRPHFTTQTRAKDL